MIADEFILEPLEDQSENVDFIGIIMKDYGNIESSELLENEINHEMVVHVLTVGSEIGINQESFITRKSDGTYYRVIRVEKKGIYLEVTARERVIRPRRTSR